MDNAVEIHAIASYRTMVHGRNLMAIAGALVVLAWLPGVEVKDFHPFGFTFDGRSLLSFWSLITFVLFYYAVRFVVDAWTDFKPWMDVFRGQVIRSKSEGGQGVHQQNADRQAMRIYRRFVWLDFALPMAFFCIGLVAAIDELRCLL